MKQDNEIEQLFKDAVSQQEIPYNPAFWSAFEQELNTKQKRKKRFFIWLFSSAALLIFGFCGLYISFNTAPKQIIEAKEQSSLSTLENSKNKLSEGNKITQKPIHKLVNTPTNLHTEKIDLQLIRNANPINKLSKSVESEEPTFSLPVHYLSEIKTEQYQLIEQHLIQQHPHKRFHLYVEAGGGIGQSSIQHSSLGHSNLSSNIFFTVGIEKRRKKLAFRAGISLENTHYDNLFIIKRSTVYGLGVTDYQQRIEYENLYSFNLPLSANYKFKGQEIGLMINPGFTYLPQLNYEYLVNSKYEDTKAIYGYKEGLNKFSVQVGFNYGKQLLPNISVGAKINIKTTPIIDHSLFDGKAVKFPIYGQLFIRKTF